VGGASGSAQLTTTPQTAICAPSPWHGGLAQMKSNPFKGKRERIGLMEDVTAIARLGLDVHAGNVEACKLKPARGTSRTVKEIEGAGPHAASW